MKHFFSIIILSIFVSSLFTHTAEAADPLPVPIINAGVVQNIWYSSVDVSDGDSIYIYGAIQNHSGVGFSGIAVFNIDGKEGTNIKFISNPDGLVEVKYNWNAVEGDHKIKLKIIDIFPIENSTSTIPVSSLLSIETEETTLSVNKKPLTLENVKDKAVDVVAKVVDNIDKLAEKLAENIQTYKKDDKKVTVTDSDKSVDQKKTVSAVAGSLSAIKNFPVFNSMLNLVSFLVEHWKSTLMGLAGLWIVIKIVGRVRV